MSQEDGKRPSPPPSPSRTTVQSIGRLSHRLVILAELQAELLKADVKDGLTAMTRPVALLLGGAMFGAGSVSVLLIAVAQAFREWAGFSPTISYLVATLVGLAIAAAAVLVGSALVWKELAVFRRSQEELRRNLAWLKEVLKHASSEDGKSDHIR
jgi:hypothetical protein